MEAKTWKPRTHHPFKHWEVISAWVPTNLPGVLLFPCKRYSGSVNSQKNNDGRKHSNYLLPYLNHHFFVHCEWVLDPFWLSQSVSFSSHISIFLMAKFKNAVNKVYSVQSSWCQHIFPNLFSSFTESSIMKVSSLILISYICSCSSQSWIKW